MTDLPTLRLKPKMDPRRLRHGYPWVYDNELVLDRRSKAIAPGSLAVLADADHTPIALVAANPGSRIAGRVLDAAGVTELTEDWFAARLIRALELRERLYPDPFYRLVHAEADGFPGVIIDRFGDTCVVQPNAAWAEVHLELLVNALRRVTGVTNVLKSAGGRARGLEGLDDVDLVLAGTAPGAPVPVPMNGAVYMADLTGGQKTGLFFDQRPNHAFTAALARGRRVLDVFSHVGGFALAALASGVGSGRGRIAAGAGPRDGGIRAIGRRGTLRYPQGRCLRRADGPRRGRCGLRLRHLRPARLCPVQAGARRRSAGL